MKNLVILAAAGLSLFGVARADDCSTTWYEKYGTKYQYQVLRAMGSDKPILESGVTVSCGKWWFDLWSAKDLSGHRTFGNEVDLTAAYDTSLFADAWKVDIELYASYGAVPEFKKVKDDILEFYVDASHSFSVDSITITPYVRPIAIVGLGVYPNRIIIRSGTRFAMPLTDRVSLTADVATTSDFYEHSVTKRFVPAIRYDAGDGWALSVDAKLADHLKPEFEIGFSKTF